jgi:hypothetical protein
MTAFTGASAISALGADRAHAGPGEKNPPMNYVPIAEKGAASGVATLDLESKIPTAQLPDFSATYASLKSVDIRSKGAVPGTTDSSAAFLAAMTDAKNSSATLPFSVGSDPRASVVIDLPPGVFTVTQLNAMIGSEKKASKTVGLKIRGAGLGLTSVIFNPSSAGALNFNDYWLSIAFEGIDFYANVAGCTFLQSYTTNNAQRYSFERCSWKNFKYVIDLQGNNNNSEFYFAFCHSDCTGQKEANKANGAFFYIGAINTSDQFLNYWFYGCTHWSTSTPFIDAAKGGSFHIYGLDASNWGADLAAKGYLFYLRGTGHSWGVTLLEAKGVRCEAKSDYSGLVYSEWSNGSVSFDAVDFTSQLFVPHVYPNLIWVYAGAYTTTQYRFTASRLAGKITVAYRSESWRASPVIKFDQCTFETIDNPADAVIYESGTPGVNDWMQPRVQFADCVGNGSQRSPLEASGYAVWDATVGFARASGEITKREVHFRQGSGSDTVRIVLPTGALISDLEVMSHAGSVSEGDGGTWTFQTSEATPTVIGTLTVATALSAGFRQSTALPVPYKCDTAAKAKIAMVPTGIGQRNDHIIVTVKGYW